MTAGQSLECHLPDTFIVLCIYCSCSETCTNVSSLCYVVLRNPDETVECMTTYKKLKPRTEAMCT